MKYVVDVTQLLHWSGNLTGIPRVMDELAIRFDRYEHEDTVFVSWVKELSQMCEVNFAKSRLQRGEGVEYIPKSSGVALSPLRTVKTSSLLKKAVKKTAVKARLDRTRVYKKAAGLNHSAAARQYKVYTPKKSDKFFIPWGEWWDQDWLDRVKSYTTNGVEIYPLCHDILPMVVPQFSGNSSSLRDFVAQIFPISTTVIVQSHSTKQDLVNWMKEHNLKVPDVQQFKLGEDFSITNTAVSSSEMTKKYAIDTDNYLVYVSTIEPRKNHTLLYYTYKLAKSRGITLPKLLIIGRVGHDTKEIIKFIKQDPEINQLIKICDYVPDDELNWLYQNCAFTIVPSFYEGWGISVVESIARGKPAVCSNTSSLKEMSSEYVIHFNPASTDECLSAIVEMMNPGTLRKYRENTKKYVSHSWDGSFKQIIKILGDG